MNQNETFVITELAAKKIKDIAEKENKSGYGLRVRASGGGCSGPQFQLGLEEKEDSGDNILDQHGLKIFLDEETLQSLTGGSLDWIEGPQGAGFKLSNPNHSQGGCGSGGHDHGDHGHAQGGGGCGSGGCGCSSGGGHEHGDHEHTQKSGGCGSGGCGCG
ncbi:MAG: iron-sulfur cluster assembly accessory protein [Deltaproteobacteria bacterium]|nr:iron-sulfur cluster assembly accessory protein [Deltaproteobacteria bacterium]